MAKWDEEQLANARLIAAVGREMKMSSRDILTAIMAAMVESGLRNVNYGDRDSLGLFQQRPSQGWGTPTEVRNPIHAATKFFEGLKGVRNRNNMSMGQAAQAVQRSAYPDRYDQHENDARNVLNTIGEKGGLPWPVTAPKFDLADQGSLAAAPQDGSMEMSPSGIEAVGTDAVLPAAGIDATTDPISAPEQPVRVNQALMPGEGHNFEALQRMTGGGARDTIVNAAMAVVGTPYSWGGGNNKGATKGIGRGAGTTGFDCSGLVQYALNKAGMGIGDMVAAQQMKLGTQTDVSKLQPGDLVAATDGSHIAIYIGNGKMIEAPGTGDFVKISTVRKGMVGIALGLAGARGPEESAEPYVPDVEVPIQSYAGI